MNLSTQLRHMLTFLAGLGTLLATWNFLEPEQVAALNKAGNDLIVPLATIGGILGVALFRLFIAWLGKALPWLGKTLRLGAGENGSGPSGGTSLLWVIGLGMTAALMGFGLPSCSSDYPITGTLSYRDPHSGAKAGLSYSPARKLRGAVTVPIYDAQTGEKLGVTDVVIGDK